MSIQRCRRCGKELTPGVSVCLSCGKPISGWKERAVIVVVYSLFALLIGAAVVVSLQSFSNPRMQEEMGSP